MVVRVITLLRGVLASMHVDVSSALMWRPLALMTIADLTAIPRSLSAHSRPTSTAAFEAAERNQRSPTLAGGLRQSPLHDNSHISSGDGGRGGSNADRTPLRAVRTAAWMEQAAADRPSSMVRCLLGSTVHASLTYCESVKYAVNVTHRALGCGRRV